MNTNPIWPNAPADDSRNWSTANATAPEKQAPKANPPGKTYKRIPLRTIGEVHAEAARIYRLARSGQMDSADCSRLASVLALIARMIEGSQLEKRVAALERRG